MFMDIDKYIEFLLEEGLEHLLEQNDLTPEEVVYHLIEHGFIAVPDDVIWAN